MRQSRDKAYVSLDGGKSWIVIHPDGHTSMQWCTPSNAPLYIVEHECECNHECELEPSECCDHECELDSL